MTCARLQSLGPVNFLVDVKLISVRMIAWISEFGVLLDVLSFQNASRTHTRTYAACAIISHIVIKHSYVQRYYYYYYCS